MTKSVTKIQDKDTTRRLSVVRSTEDPTKYGVVILNPDGSKIRWPKGDKWDAGTIEVGTTCTWEPWTNACVVNSWTCTSAVLDFTIPRGEKGCKGDSWEMSVGTTCTWDAGTCACVVNVGTSTNAILNFTIPKGDKWDTGNTATVSVGSTSTLCAGCNATVSNSGDCHNAVLNFGIPKWDKGDIWNAATVSVGNTTTLDAGCCASVSNSWTQYNAVLDFCIPKGDKGDTWAPWCTWATWNWIASITCSKEWKVTTVTIEETNGCCACFTVCDGQDWEGSGDVLWPSSATSGNIVLFDGNSGKCIKQWGAVVDALNSSSGTDVLSAKQWCILNSSISSINGKIPSEASSSNQLADKCFVNSSINSLAAFYITKDAQGDQFDSYLELSSATTFYSGGQVRVPTQNDYTIVAVDETHDNATTRYSYQWNQWEYQYTVNETALTQSQLDALNSWITATKVCCYDGYATWKQDCLISGCNIVTVNGCSLLGCWNITTPNTTYSQATCSDLWLIKLGSNTAQSVSANAVTWCNWRTYALQVNSSGQGVVNVPRENTTYSAWDFDIRNLADACCCRTAWSGKQEALVSWCNIKTVNGTSLLGSWNIDTPNTTYSQATDSNLWLIKLWSSTVQGCSAENVSSNANRTYAIQVNNSWQAVVNVPWENTQCVSSVNGCTGVVNVNPFSPASAWTTGQIVTKTADGYDWGDKPTKVFTLASMSDLTTAQAAYDWWAGGNLPIIMYQWLSAVYIPTYRTSTYLYFISARWAWGINSWDRFYIEGFSFSRSWNTITSITYRYNRISISSSAPAASTTNNTVTLVI